MTDFAMTDTLENLAARLTELEARLGPVPQAVPPVTIGELSDVPAPGAPIASQWAQEVTRRSVHRFASVTARDAAYPAAGAGSGAMCVTTDTGTLWESNGTAWVALSSVGAWAGWAVVLTQGPSLVGTINNAHWTRNGRLITAQCSFTATAAGSTSTQITVSLPVPALYPASLAVGVMEWRRAATAIRTSGVAWLNNANSVIATVSGAADSTVGSAFIVNVNDTVNLIATYEAAT